MKEERRPEYPEKPADDKLRKMPHTKIQAPSETRTRSLASVAGAYKESRLADHYTMCRRFLLRVPQ